MCETEIKRQVNSPNHALTHSLTHSLLIYSRTLARKHTHMYMYRTLTHFVIFGQHSLAEEHVYGPLGAILHVQAIQDTVAVDMLHLVVLHP